MKGGTLTDVQIKHIDDAMTRISQICELKGQPIVYDIDSVVEKDGVFNISSDVMNTLIFFILFKEHKSTIYSDIFRHTFSTFFPHKSTNTERLFYTFRQIKVAPMNMNKFLLVLIPEHRLFFYDYIKNMFIGSIELFIKYIDEKSQTVGGMIGKQLIRTKRLLLQYSDLCEMTLTILENERQFIHTCNNALDSFIKTRIKFHNKIPNNVMTVIRKQAYIASVERIPADQLNEGLQIEKDVTLLIKDPHSIIDVIKSNVFYLDLEGNLPSANKKGEFDLVIGAFDVTDQVFKIKSIYDIKRSARLIPEDIDKFNNSLNTDFILRDPIDQSRVNTQKLADFKRGYLYIIDWDIEIESRFKLREILIKYILEHGGSFKFFQFLCEQINIEGYFKFNKNFMDRLRQLMNKDNHILQSKLSKFDIHKCPTKIS